MKALAIAAGVGFAMIVVGQAPVIYPHGILNAASFSPAGLPNGGIAQGSVFTIFGSALGPAQGVSASSFPLGNTLAGVSITVTQGTTTVNVLPLFVSAGQINALMPSQVPLGMGSVRVTFNGRSNYSPVQIVASSFGIFAVNSAGSGPGVLQNFFADRLPVNSLTQAAKPGQTMILYGTGLGAVSFPDNVAPTPGNVNVKTEVLVGGKAASVQYNGRSSRRSGLDQINFTVPADVPAGCWVPVYVKTAGKIISNFVTIAVDAGGAACSEPNNALAKTFIQGGTAGTMRLFRTSSRQDVATLAPIDVTTDAFVFDFAQLTGSQFAYSALFSLPPLGTCTVFAGTGDMFTQALSNVATTAKTRLSPGSSFTLTGPRGSKTLTPNASQQAVFLGSYAPFVVGLNDQTYLDPGAYKISSAGADVGAFQASLNLPAPFVWTNRSQMGIIDRTRPVTVTWSGLPQGQSMMVMGGDADLATNSSAVFVCQSAKDTTSFTIPADILSAVPATRPNPLKSKTMLYLSNIQVTNGVPIQAPSVDAAVGIAGYLQGKTVVLQ